MPGAGVKALRTIAPVHARTLVGLPVQDQGAGNRGVSGWAVRGNRDPGVEVVSGSTSFDSGAPPGGRRTESLMRFYASCSRSRSTTLSEHSTPDRPLRKITHCARLLGSELPRRTRYQYTCRPPRRADLILKGSPFRVAITPKEATHARI
jgi:hypothetical protein